MRRVLVSLLALAACTSKKPSVEREDAATPSVVASARPDAAPPVEVEKPLTWGTRPPVSGPLYPVIDGMCIHGEIRATKGMTLYTYGTLLGHFSRGGATTFGRITDDGVVRDATLEQASEKEHAGDWANTGGFDLVGEWPNLILRSSDQGARTRSNSSLWQQTEKGWAYLGSTDEKDEPYYSGEVVFKGWVLALRHAAPADHKDYGEWPIPTLRTWPMTPGAAPIPGIQSLLRAGFRGSRLEVVGDRLYAYGSGVVRMLEDGKASEGTFPPHFIAIGPHEKALVGHDGASVVQIDGLKATTQAKLPPELGKVVGSGIAPNGDVWLLDAKNKVAVVRGDKAQMSTLPESTAKLSRDDSEHKALLGGALAGIEFDDPYAMNDLGSVFHFDNGEWHELEMPKPPFATNGKYQAQSLVVTARGDLLVNAAYSEKGIGWKTAERYRALLRTRRPKEVLRCNEPANASASSTGTDFSSAPPVADDSCPTPFVILLRLGSKKEPLMLHDKQGKYPPLRNAIKATPELGPTADMLEVPWGNLQVIGMKAPNMATAKALALNAAKLVKVEFLETRPEIVCGVPPSIDRTIPVDVATGKVITEDASAK